MNTFALNNIDILKSLNENDKFSFDKYELIKEFMKNNNSISTEYGLYFTFHEIFTLIDNGTRDRDVILRDVNNSIDNLYENEFFLNLIDENSEIKEMMDEVCTKVDILTEKYLHKSFCRVIADELYRYSLVTMRSIVNTKRATINIDEVDDEDEEDFVTEETTKKIKDMEYILNQNMDIFLLYSQFHSHLQFLYLVSLYILYYLNNYFL